MEDIKWLSDAELLKRIGNKIKEWRLEADLTQQRTAELGRMSLITFQNIERGKGGSFANYLRILRVLDRLDVLDIFIKEKELSPIEFQKFEQGLRQKQRASRKNHAADTDNTPVW